MIITYKNACRNSINLYIRDIRLEYLPISEVMMIVDKFQQLPEAHFITFANPVSYIR